MSIATLGQLLASDTVHCGSSARSSEKTTSLVVHTLFSLIPARFKISVDSASRQVQTRASEYTYPTSIRGSIRFKLSAQNPKRYWHGPRYDLYLPRVVLGFHVVGYTVWDQYILLGRGLQSTQLSG